MEPPAHPAPDRIAVLLAAGAGTRFAGTGHKLTARLATPDEAHTSVFGRALANVVDADIGPVVVVTGAVDLTSDPVLRQVTERGADVHVHDNPQWADGQATSLQVAVRVARQIGATALVVGLADQPFVTPAAWQRVALGLGTITVATYDGRRGHPVRLHADVWDMLPSRGDEGARILMRTRPDLVAEVPCTGSPADIDTLEDLRRWQSN